MTWIQECDNSVDECDNSVITGAAREVSNCSGCKESVYVAEVSVCINADYTT